PFEKWRHDHNVHHATSGNLDKRGVGDIWMMTVTEYKEASFWTKLAYRAYRNPIVMFGLGPLYLLLIDNRINNKGAKRKERWNTYATNLVLVVIYGALVWAAGWQAVLIIQGPMMYIAGVLGIWLFYVQHQFEESYFEHDEAWNYVN